MLFLLFDNLQKSASLMTFLIILWEREIVPLTWYVLEYTMILEQYSTGRKHSHRNRGAKVVIYCILNEYGQ